LNSKAEIVIKHGNGLPEKPQKLFDDWNEIGIEIEIKAPQLKLIEIRIKNYFHKLKYS